MQVGPRLLRRSALLALGLYLAGAALPAPAASRFTATIDPPDFNVNESAELTITATGDEDAVPLIPRVPGLVINPEGQSSSIVQQPNGTVRAIFSRTYRVTATHEGNFTIPPIQVGSATTVALSVHVSAPGSPTPGPAAPQAQERRSTPADLAAAVRAAMPVMKVLLPRPHLYVGELVPIQIKAYFHEGVSTQLDGPLAAVGDAFTVSGLDKRPTQTQEEVDGHLYTVLTWNSVLGALKSGEYPLGLELPVTLNIQLPGTDADMAARLRALFGTNARGAFLDDSDFGNLFGRVVQKSVTVKPEATPIDVLPLPSAGRPADFTGAVGQFQLRSELTPSSGTVGDPLTYKLTVTGKGNLARVSAAALQDSAQWRAYHAEAKVTADDETGLQGLKTFSQPVVPLEAGQLSLPGASFSYFDPEAARYVTRTTAPIRVAVAPGAGGASLAATLQGGGAAPAAAATADALAADEVVTAEHRASLEPLYRRPWFAAAALTPVLLMLATVSLIRRHRLRSADPALMLHAARLAAVRINLESMAAALNRGDAPAFFSAARHALQEKLADLWQVPAASVDARLIAAKLPGPPGAQLRAIFAMAEKATYAGMDPGSSALQEWQRRVQAQLDQLEGGA